MFMMLLMYLMEKKKINLVDSFKEIEVYYGREIKEV